MKAFERKLVLGAWTDHPAIRHLFSRWDLPGRPACGGLRIGIRAGYLNLYVRGQSVAKLTGGKQGAKLEVHPAYVEGLKKVPDRSQPKRRFDRYCRFASDSVSETDIDRWIATAATYSGAEKAFVDDLVAANPGTIDLEMGLPANPGELSAPRMDLVVAQDGDIAFWEAKCSNNPELRAEATYEETKEFEYVRGIHVIHQLRKYVRWMEHEQCDRRAEVAKGYRDAATILLKLADAFGRPGDEARAAWQMLADNPAPHVILAPGIVIGNYDALNQAKDAGCDRQATVNAQYIERIRSRHGAVVAEIPSADCATLPRLTPHVVRA
ncbi:hypothetical protein NSE01_36940 [Novosphingobium sediminis]|uniref:Uncharacterized protein n=1 Tax=Novosphingobium sediminis TaxID=707214 RepID=A0A512AQ99_9SPHN|nr:hypothetical protein [Novosphingobium sediminis]GEO01862.1 hypothetical protein NSE01_36940 [Novosphingobium sediminis]